MSWPELLGSWYSGEVQDADEVKALWMKSFGLIVGLIVLSQLAP